MNRLPSSLSFRAALMAFAASASTDALAVPLANALPTGFSVVTGSVADPTTAGDLMTIIQNTGFALVDWTTFSIGKNVGVEFVQPTASAVILNRVTSLGNPSEIFGSITANGTVGIFNPGGVLFGPASAINVGGLVASTLSMTATKLPGNDVSIDLDITGADADATVVNRGAITATNGDVLLVGRGVVNRGTITTEGTGSVTLTGADSASLLLERKAADQVRRIEVTADGPIGALSSGGTAGVTNTGTITSRTILLNAEIAPGLLDHVVNNSGLLVASGVDVDGQREGGTVKLVAAGAGIDGSGGQAIAQGFGANADGKITVDAGGDVVMGLADAGDAGTVVLSATGAMTDGNGTDVNVRADTTDIEAGGNINLDTEIATLEAESTGGRLTIDEADGLASAHLKTATGRIALTANGTIEALRIRSLDGPGGGGASVVTSTGDIVIDEIAMGAPDGQAETVRVEATNGSILDDVDDGGLDIGAGRIELVAGTGIGGGANGSLDLVGDVDLAVTGPGNIDVASRGGFSALSAQTADGSIRVSAGLSLVANNIVSLTDSDANDITLRSRQGNVTVDHVDAGATAGDVKIVANSIREIASDTGIDITGDNVALNGNMDDAAAIDTDANSLDLRAATGTIRIDERNDVTVDATASGPININAGGNMTVGQITGTGGSEIRLTADRRIDDGNGDAVNVKGSNLVLLTGRDIDLDTNVDSITADVGAGDVSLNEANAVTLNVETFNGAIDVVTGGTATIHKLSTAGNNAGNITVTTTSGNIRLGGNPGGSNAIVAQGDADVQLTSAGSVIDDSRDNDRFADVFGDHITIDAVSGIGVGANGSIETGANQLDLSVSGAGAINVADGSIDTVVVNTATTANGSISISSNGNLQIADVTSVTDSDANDITLSAADDLVLGTVNAAGAGDAFLAAGGRILDDVADAVTDVTADAVTLAGGTGVGQAAGTGSIDTSANTLAATLSETGGAIRIDEADAVTLDGVDARNGSIQIAAGDLTLGTLKGGDVLLVTTGSMADGNGNATNVSATDLRLRAQSGIDLDIETGTVDARVLTAGNIDLREADDVARADLRTANGDVSLAARGNIGAGRIEANNVVLDAGGAITDANGAIGNVFAPGNLTVKTGNGGVDLDTDVASLDGRVKGGNVDIEDASGLVITDLVARDGDIDILAHGGIDAQRVVAADRAVSLNADGSDLTVGVVNGGDVNLRTTGGILDGNGDATNIGGGSLTARSPLGIDLDTNVDRITAEVTGAGGTIAIDERNGVTLAQVETADGDIRIDAGGTITLGRVTAGGTNDVHLGSSGGAIVDDVNDDVIDVDAFDIDLSASSGIGSVATGSVDTRGTNVKLDVTGAGGIALDHAGDLALDTVSVDDGNVHITSSGQMSVFLMIVDGNVHLETTRDGRDLRVDQIIGDNVRLTAGGSIVDTNDINTNVRTQTLTADAGGSIDLDTAADRIDASGVGAVRLDEFDGVTLRDVSARNGTVTVTANDTLVAQRVSTTGASAGDITLSTSAGNLVAGEVDAGSANVVLTANTLFDQQVLDDGRAATGIRANRLDVAASAGIGALDAPLGTEVATLSADAGTGPLAIRETDGLTLESAVTDGGGIAVRAGGNLVAGDVNAGTGDVALTSSGGAITDDGLTDTRVAGATLTARAASGVTLDTRVQRVGATTTAGNVVIDDQGGNLEVASVRGDTVTLGSSGALIGVGDAPNVHATSLTATAGGRIDLSTSVDSVTAQVTDAGSITLTESGAIELTDVSTAAGDVTVSAGGNIVTGAVRGDTTRLTSGGAIVDGNGVGTVNVTGDVLVADAQNGIDLDTEVNTIRRATTVNGSVDIREATSAAIGTVQGKTVNLTAGGALTDENGDTTNVTADTLVARAVDGIDLDTNIDTLDAEVTGAGNLDIADSDALTIRNARTHDGDLRLATANDGNLLILDAGEIDAGDGDVTLDIAGGIRQESRRSDASISGGSLTIQAGGNVGQLLAPLFVNIGGPVTVAFDSDRPVALITGIFGSLNEGGQVFGLGQNTELSNSVGAIQSSFQKTVTFNLDSSQFATQTRIYTTEGTGILLPEEVRE